MPSEIRQAEKDNHPMVSSYVEHKKQHGGPQGKKERNEGEKIKEGEKLRFFSPTEDFRGDGSGGMGGLGDGY